MADLEALSAPNRSIFQPLSYSSPTDMNVGRLNYLPTIENINNQFDKGYENASKVQDVLSKYKSLAADDPRRKAVLQEYEDRLTKATSSADPYLIQKETKNLANQFVRDIQDPSTEIGSHIESKINYDDSLARAKENPIHLNRTERALRKYQGTSSTIEGGSPTFRPSTLKKLNFTEFDKVKDMNSAIAGYDKDGNKVVETHISTGKEKDAVGNILPKGTYYVKKGNSNVGVSISQAQQFFEQLKGKDNEMNQAFREEAEANIYNNYEKKGTLLPDNVYEKAVQEEYKKLRDDYKNAFVNKLASNVRESSFDIDMTEEAKQNLQSKGISDILEQVHKKETGYTGQFKNTDNQYVDDESKLTGNHIILDGKKYYPEEAAKELLTQGKITQKEFEATKTIFNNKANFSLGKTILNNLNPLSQGQQTNLNPTEEALLSSKLSNLGYSISDNKNKDLSSKQMEWIKSSMYESPEYQKLLKLNGGDPESAKFNQGLEGFIENNKDKYLERYKNYTSKLGKVTGSGSKNDENVIKDSETKILPSEFLGGNGVTFDDSFNNVSRKDFGDIESFKESLGIDNKDEVTFRKVLTNRNYDAGGSQWQIEIKKPDGSKKEGYASVAPSPEMKKIYQPIKTLWQGVNSGNPAPKYYVWNGDEIQPITSVKRVEQIKNGFDDNIKPDDLLKVESYDYQGNYKSPTITGNTGYPEDLHEYTKRIEESRASKISELNNQGINIKDREKQTLMNAVQQILGNN